jgi:tetratricopeptide (TPR) repeat protein
MSLLAVRYLVPAVPVMAVALAAAITTSGVSPTAPAETMRTTNASIALGNLDAQIHGLQARAARTGLGAGQRAELAALLAGRAQYTGRIADRDEAVEIGESLGRDFPDDPNALLARAHARAMLHRFADALADLGRAAARGASPAAADDARAAILQAMGRYDDALAIRLAVAARRPDVDSLGALASLRAERGERDEAAGLYEQARRSYRDVSPFPVAWLDFDEGLMWMRENELARARDLFARAYRRVPAFAAARCHLAEMEAALGNIDVAVGLLRPLAADSDDPDAAGQLARILIENGRSDEARHWRDRAATRYDELVTRHPEAYADHAAEFWLAAGDDPRRALALARLNLSNRQTPRAYELVAAATAAAAR